jgi:hypothetical protein
MYRNAACMAASNDLVHGIGFGKNHPQPTAGSGTGRKTRSFAAPMAACHPDAQLVPVACDLAFQRARPSTPIALFVCFAGLGLLGYCLTVMPCRRRSRVLLVFVTVQAVAHAALINMISFATSVTILTTVAYLWSIDAEQALLEASTGSMSERDSAVEASMGSSMSEARDSAVEAEVRTPVEPRRQASPLPRTPPEKLATPVLQAKLRQALGPHVALPTRKEALVAMFKKHVLTD